MNDDFACSQCASNWTIRFCCLAVFEDLIVLLNNSRHLHFIRMMTNLSVTIRNDMHRCEDLMVLLNNSRHLHFICMMTNLSVTIRNDMHRCKRMYTCLND